MKVEIERKFLVHGDGFLREAVGCRRLEQGYICRESGRTVRVRMDDGRGWLTIKGRSTADGTSRNEWEWEIPADEARALLGLCTGKIIRKDRYIVPAAAACGGLKWEVDVFHGDHEGLVLAEIELEDADCGFERPDWLGEEVTGDRRYYNSVLSA